MAMQIESQNLCFDPTDTSDRIPSPSEMLMDRHETGKAYEKAAIASSLIDRIAVEEILKEYLEHKRISHTEMMQITSFINNDIFSPLLSIGRQERQVGEYKPDGVFSGYTLQWEDSRKPWFREGVRGSRHYSLTVGIADLTDFNVVLGWVDAEKYPEDSFIYRELKGDCAIKIGHSATPTKMHVPLVGYNGQVCATERGIQTIRESTVSRLQSLPMNLFPRK